MFTKLKQTFIGRPLKSLTEGEGGLLGKMQALARDFDSYEVKKSS